MQLEIWKITGQGFHFGQQGLGQEETTASFPSDSLFSALVARLAGLEGAPAVEAFAKPFQEGNPPFLLTSTFPFAGGVDFFPNPAHHAHQQPAAQRNEAVRPKDLKKVQWVSESIFRRLLKGEQLQDMYPQALMLQGKSCLVAPEEIPELPHDLQKPDAKIWNTDQRPRVAVGRASPKSNLFFTGQVHFAEACGLWFGIQWLTEDPGIRARVNWLLDELAIAGLGGERSAGFGHCKIQQQLTWKELPDAPGKPWINLSRYHPKPDELSALLDPGASYKIVPVGGWLDSPVRRGQRRRLLNLLAEGSVLGPLTRSAPGQLVDVRPAYPSEPDPLGHPVYRSGLAVAVGIETGIEGRSL